MKRLIFVAALACLVTSDGARADSEPVRLRDGRNFDPGATMAEPSTGAPEKLAKAGFLLGNWTVEVEIPGAGDAEGRKLSGTAQISFMNRGHGLMETLHIPDFDGAGTDLTHLGMLVYNPGSKQWVWGAGDSHSESVSLANGELTDGSLVLYDARRPLGRVQLTWIRHTWTRLPEANTGFRHEIAHSSDRGDSWTSQLIRTYRPSGDAPVFANADDHGSAAPGLPDEAREFDFLIGEWTAVHDLRLPNGQNPKWASHSTARFALDGHAVLEFNSFDTDPSLPDAATTILRIYNRAMKRWESLYASNRGHGLLHFGGQREGDAVVLHHFDHHTGDPQIFRYVFHDIKADSFQWYSEMSQDRGSTFNKNWIIQVERKPRGDAASAE